jgi:hypothetical protein
MKPEVSIGLGTEAHGRDDGQLKHPCGVSFTTDGRCLLVADWGNHRVCKFSTASGAFIAHVATWAANGIQFPTDVLQCEAGGIVVVYRYNNNTSSMMCIGEDGVAVKNISGKGFFAFSLSYSVNLKAVVVKTREGKVFLLPDAWLSSNRCSWLSALSCY